MLRIAWVFHWISPIDDSHSHMGGVMYNVEICTLSVCVYSLHALKMAKQMSYFLSEDNWCMPVWGFSKIKYSLCCRQRSHGGCFGFPSTPRRLRWPHPLHQEILPFTNCNQKISFSTGALGRVVSTGAYTTLALGEWDIETCCIRVPVDTNGGGRHEGWPRYDLSESGNEDAAWAE